MGTKKGITNTKYISPVHLVPRALSLDERIVLMRVILRGVLRQGILGRPPRFLQDLETQKALSNEVLSVESLRFYVDRIALWDKGVL